MAAFFNLRSAIRIDLNAFVTAPDRYQGQAREYEVFRNVSEAGCGIEAKQSSTSRKYPHFSFYHLPPEIIGAVVNIRPSNSPEYKHFGIKFTDDSLRNRRRINQFILKAQALDAEEDESGTEG